MKNILNIQLNIYPFMYWWLKWLNEPYLRLISNYHGVQPLAPLISQCFSYTLTVQHLSLLGNEVWKVIIVYVNLQCTTKDLKNTFAEKDICSEPNYQGNKHKLRTRFGVTEFFYCSWDLFKLSKNCCGTLYLFKVPFILWNAPMWFLVVPLN